MLTLVLKPMVFADISAHPLRSHDRDLSFPRTNHSDLELQSQPGKALIKSGLSLGKEA